MRMRPQVTGKTQRKPLDAAHGSAWRAEWLRAVRQHHPDVGGDPQEYLRVTADIDRRHSHGPLTTRRNVPDARVHPSVRSDRRSRARLRIKASVRRARAVSKTMRSRLPRWAPGARRYTRI